VASFELLSPHALEYSNHHRRMAELSGLGVGIEIEDSLADDEVWKVLEFKVTSPQTFLPVTDVVHRPSDDGKGTYREMTTMFNAANGLPERRIIENIYCLKDKLEVLFVVCDDKNEHVNAININSEGKRQLEFYLRDAATKERVEWLAPKAVVHNGIAAVLRMAREGLPA